MKYLCFIRHSEKYRDSGPPLKIATEFMDLHRKHWPAFEGESEVRPMFEPGKGP